SSADNQSGHLAVFPEQDDLPAQQVRACGFRRCFAFVGGFLLPEYNFRTRVNGVVNLLPVDGHLHGSHNPEAHLTTTRVDNRDPNLVVDDDRLTLTSGQHEHWTPR